MSKGLKALKSLVDKMPLVFIETNSMKYIEIIEKELKALEILKKHIRIVKPFDLETKEEEPFEIFDIDLWHEGKQKEDFEFVKEVLL